MFAIIGIVVVFGAVIGGFLMEKGHMAVLVQPAELLIIAGAATLLLESTSEPKLSLCCDGSGRGSGSLRSATSCSTCRAATTICGR